MLFDVAIDVSDAQGEIDWEAVAASGIKVAMIKATEGTTFTANTWDHNRREALDAGIKIIPYHFIRPGFPAEQAELFRSIAGLAHGMAYALDWEGSRTATAADVERLAASLIEITGRKPLGYWGIPGSTPDTPTSLMQMWDRWVPRYPVRHIANFEELSPTHQSPGVPFLFWQYTSEGEVDGIDGQVDRSVGSFESLDRLIDWCS